MTDTPAGDDNQSKIKIIRDKAFARRLNKACEDHPHCPTDQYRGKQKWVYEGLEREFGVKVSAEAVRKWFSGESRPRPKVMAFLARLLDVDEAWLSLGIVPEISPQEKMRRNALANGGVNLLAGLIQLAGGNIAFPESEDEGVDIYAILGGKQFHLDVAIPLPTGRFEYKVVVRDKLERKHFIIVVQDEEQTISGIRLIHLPAEVVAQYGNLRGGYRELMLEERGEWWRIGDARVHVLETINDLLKVGQRLQ